MELLPIALVLIAAGAVLLYLKLAQQRAKDNQPTYVCDLCDESHCECTQQSTGS
jgi:hypothetical protein